MPGRVCVPCQRQYRAERNGVHAVEMMDNDTRPYKIWMADLLRCPGCEHQILSGFGANPVSEHYMPEFDKWMKHVEFTVKEL
jgi:hypothetical protein